jgi:hypothetical protein
MTNELFLLDKKVCKTSAAMVIGAVCAALI